MNGTGPLGQGASTGRSMGSCGAKVGTGSGCCGGYGQGHKRLISLKNELSTLEEEEKRLLADLEVVKAKKEALNVEK